MSDYNEWANGGKAWKIQTIQGASDVDADKDDQIVFFYDTGTKRLKFGGFTCPHIGSGGKHLHGASWQGVECLGNQNAAVGIMKTSGALFLIVGSDDGHGLQTLTCSIATDLKAFTSATSTICWTANDGG